MLISLLFLREHPLQRFRRCDDRRVLVFLSHVFAEKRENQPTARSSRTPSLFVLDSPLPFLREPVICVRQRHSHITRGKLRTTRNALFSQRRFFDATSSQHASHHGLCAYLFAFVKLIVEYSVDRYVAFGCTIIINSLSAPILDQI